MSLFLSSIFAMVICPEIFAPVCADGKEFPSECQAKAAGITEFTNGKCTKEQEVICPAIFAPVCANGKEFGNECEAKAAGITTFTNGACKKASKCPKKY